MRDLPYIFVSGIGGFLAGAIIGAWFGVQGITMGSILGMWIVMFLLRRKHASAE